MSKNTTKRSLLASVFALVLCVAMLVGSTFAWFTDTASTGVNKIVSGNLKVDIIGENSGSHVDELKFTKAAMTDTEAAAELLWEPGCRYLTEGFRIANKGNLALKWKAEINKDNIVNGKVVDTAKDGVSLLDVIDFYVVTGTDKNAAAVAIEDFTGKLGKDETSQVYYIKGVMKTTAGNDYQNLTLDGITITVYATQDTVESDSFNNEYDKGAEYATAVGTADELSKAISAGENVVLKSDLSISSALTVPAGETVNIDMNGKTVTATGTFINVQKGSKLTLTGGTVNSGRYVFNVKDGEVVVNDADLKAQECVYALFSGSKLTVNGGTYTSKDNAVIATNGSSVKGCEITINGGVFNANISSAGYIACGVYVANKDVVKINRATFNVTDGVGVLMRAGDTTIGKDVVINLTNTGKVTAGKVGDAVINIATPSYLVMDVRSGYPGATAGFTITNHSAYDVVEYK